MRVGGPARCGSNADLYLRRGEDLGRIGGGSRQKWMDRLLSIRHQTSAEVEPQSLPPIGKKDPPSARSKEGDNQSRRTIDDGVGMFAHSNTGTQLEIVGHSKCAWADTQSHSQLLSGLESVSYPTRYYIVQYSYRRFSTYIRYKRFP